MFCLFRLRSFQSQLPTRVQVSQGTTPRGTVSAETRSEACEWHLADLVLPGSGLGHGPGTGDRPLPAVRLGPIPEGGDVDGNAVPGQEDGTGRRCFLTAG